MKNGYIFLLVIWIFASQSVLPAAQAAEPAPAGQEAPFGEGDPFSLIEDKQGSPMSDGEAARKTAHKPEARAEVFLKGFDADINSSSRINPDNRIQKLREYTGTVETRMIMTDHLDREETLRWLFRGFAVGDNYHQPDGTLHNETARVDELFLDWKGENRFVSVGKRRINWGYAQGFNAVNVVVPPRDPLDPEYQTEGQPMIWGSLSRAHGVVDAIFTRNYDKNWNSDQNRWGLKWGGSRGDSDYALYYFDGAAYADGRDFERMFGASYITVAVPGMTLYVDAARFERNYRNFYTTNGATQSKSGGYSKGVIGSSYNLGGKSSVFVEYLFNGQGYSEEERANYLNAADARLTNGADETLLADFTPLGMNRSYLLASAKKEFREKYTAVVSILLAEDRSSSTRAEIAYSISDYYEAHAVYLHNSGGRDSEFGNGPYSGLFEIGLKASF